MAMFSSPLLLAMFKISMASGQYKNSFRAGRFKSVSFYENHGNNMQQQSIKNLCFILSFSCLLGIVLAQCNSCQPNKAACVNETHFKMCHDNIRDDDSVLDCGAGKVCTSLAAICFEEGLTEPACQKKDVNCRTCDDDTMFVCTSRTTFRMCNGLKLSPVVNRCPPNKVCSIDSGSYCVDECQITGQIECDRLEEVV